MKTEDALLALHKKYNMRWSESLMKHTTIFQSASLLGAKLKDGSFTLYRLLFDDNGPWVESIEICEAIGSGALLAKLLKILSRAADSSGTSLAHLSINKNVWAAPCRE